MGLFVALLLCLSFLFMLPRLCQEYCEKHQDSIAEKKRLRSEKRYARRWSLNKRNLLWFAILRRLAFLLSFSLPMLILLTLLAIHGGLSISILLGSFAIVIGYITAYFYPYCKAFLLISRDSIQRLNSPEMISAMKGRYLFWMGRNYKACIDDEIFIIVTPAQLLAFHASQIDFSQSPEPHQKSIWMLDSRHGTILHDFSAGYRFSAPDGNKLTLHADTFITEAFCRWFQEHSKR